MKSKLTVYKDKKKHFRWRIKRSGRTVAESGEGYTRLRSLARTLKSLFSDVQFCGSRTVDRAIAIARINKFRR